MDAEWVKEWILWTVNAFQPPIYPCVFLPDMLEQELFRVSPVRWLPACFCQQGALEGALRA